MPSDLLATSPEFTETRRLTESAQEEVVRPTTEGADPPGHSGVTAERFGLALAIVITAIHALTRLDATALWLD